MSIKEDLEELIDERDALLYTRNSAVKELVAIADALGVEPKYAVVMPTIAALKDCAREAHDLQSRVAAMQSVVDDYKANFEQVCIEADEARAEADELSAKLAEIAHDATVGAAQGSLGTVLTMLARGVDASTAKNYAEMRFNWDAGILPQLPFRTATVTFIRDGGKTPGDLVKELKRELDLLRPVLEAAKAVRARGVLLALDPGDQRAVDHLGDCVKDAEADLKDISVEHKP